MDADEKPDPNAEPMTPDKFQKEILEAFADKTKHFDDIEKDFDEKDEKMVAEIKKNKDNFERLDEIEKELDERLAKQEEEIKAGTTIRHSDLKKNKGIPGTLDDLLKSALEPKVEPKDVSMI